MVQHFESLKSGTFYHTWKYYIAIS